MRLVICLIPLLFLSACGMWSVTGIAGTDVALAGAAVGLVYGDDIAEAAGDPEGITLDDISPPRAKDTLNRAAGHTRDGIRNTGKHLKDWWFHDAKAKGEAKAIPSSYCYRTQGDVLCYRAPMPGWEHRLVGYQGTYAKAPPPVLMQPLPGQTVNPSMLPGNRVANAKPVFVELPPEAKEEAPKDPAALLETDPQNVQETIQDPSISPQL